MWTVITFPQLPYTLVCLNQDPGKIHTLCLHKPWALKKHRAQLTM